MKAVSVDVSGNYSDVWRKYPKEFLQVVGAVMREHTVNASAQINKKNASLKEVIISRNKRQNTRWKKDGTSGANLQSDMTSSHYKKNPNFWGVRFSDNRTSFIANNMKLTPLNDYRDFLSGNDPTVRLAERLEKRYAELTC